MNNRPMQNRPVKILINRYVDFDLDDGQCGNFPEAHGGFANDNSGFSGANWMLFEKDPIRLVSLEDIRCS